MSRNITLFDVATTGLGICALYVGVTWLKTAFDHMHVANAYEKSGDYQSVQAVNRSLENYTGDKGEFGGADQIVNAIANVQIDAVMTAKIKSGMYALGGGLMLFGTYKSGSSLVNNQRMEIAEKAVNTIGALVVASQVIRKI